MFAWLPLSSSLAEEERLRSLLVHYSLRSLRLALCCRCLPHSLADEERVRSLDRPGQRRASLAPCGGARFPTLAVLYFLHCSRIALGAESKQGRLLLEPPLLLASVDQKSMPPMPPSPPGGMAGAFSGLSAITASVLKKRPAIEAAFCSAERVTLVGSGALAVNSDLLSWFLTDDGECQHLILGQVPARASIL